MVFSVKRAFEENKTQNLFNLESKKLWVLLKLYELLTYFVGCKLQMTRRPALYFFVFKGKVPLGTICNVVPRQILRSATL